MAGYVGSGQPVAFTDNSVETSDIIDGSVTDAKLNSAKLNGIASNANNYSHPATHAINEVSGLQTALDGKTNEAYVDTQISNLVGAAPAALNTLQELGDALGDDANYASTVTTSLTNLQTQIDDNEILALAGL